MTLMIDLTREEERTLKQKASERGLAPNDYARQLIAGHLQAGAAETVSQAQTQSPQEWEQSVNTWLQGNYILPVLSDYAVSRESMYEGRE